jgi:hypothetical protein
MDPDPSHSRMYLMPTVLITGWRTSGVLGVPLFEPSKTPAAPVG